MLLGSLRFQRYVDRGFVGDDEIVAEPGRPGAGSRAPECTVEGGLEFAVGPVLPLTVHHLEIAQAPLRLDEVKDPDDRQAEPEVFLDGKLGFQGPDPGRDLVPEEGGGLERFLERVVEERGLLRKLLRGEVDSFVPDETDVLVPAGAS